MLPVEWEPPLLLLLLLLLLFPFFSLLWVDCRCDTGASHRVVGVILRAGVRRWAEALARLVIPSSTALQAGCGGRSVPAVAAARLLPPLLVLQPAAGRLQATATPTGKLVLHLQGGALLLARTATKGAPGTTRRSTREQENSKHPPCEQHGHLAQLSGGGNTGGQTSVATSAASTNRHMRRSQLVVRTVRRPRNLHHLENSGFETFLYFQFVQQP